MNIETRQVGFLPATPTAGRRVTALFRTASRLAAKAVGFLDALLIAGAVAKQAERYYEMSNSQLAEIGLTREQIPALLLRQLERSR